MQNKQKSQQQKKKNENANQKIIHKTQAKQAEKKQNI